MKIVASDFDGTLYSGDSTMDFLKYSFRKYPVLVRFLPAMGIAALRHYGSKLCFVKRRLG